MTKKELGELVTLMNECISDIDQKMTAMGKAHLKETKAHLKKDEQDMAKAKEDYRQAYLAVMETIGSFKAKVEQKEEEMMK